MNVEDLFILYFYRKDRLINLVTYALLLCGIADPSTPLESQTIEIEPLACLLFTNLEIPHLPHCQI